jgi:hypothetical protein
LKVFLFAILYGLLGHFSLELATNSHLMSAKTTALVVGFVWILGWVWGIGAVIAGPKAGTTLLRVWAGTVIGMMIAVLPFAILRIWPVIIGGFVLGYGAASWIITGKADWLIR